MSHQEIGGFLFAVNIEYQKWRLLMNTTISILKDYLE